MRCEVRIIGSVRTLVNAKSEQVSDDFPAYSGRCYKNHALMRLFNFKHVYLGESEDSFM